MAGISLLDTVRLARPDALIGLTGRGGLFTEDILRTLVCWLKKPSAFFKIIFLMLLIRQADASVRFCFR